MEWGRENLARGLKMVIGQEQWQSLGLIKRAMLVEFCEYYISNISLGKPLYRKELEGFAKAKIQQARKEEMYALLNRDHKLLNHYGFKRNEKETFYNKLKKMDGLLEKLRDVKFDNKLLEDSRLAILESLDNKIPLPCYDIDVYVISTVVPNFMSDEEKKKFEEWLKEQEPKT